MTWKDRAGRWLYPGLLLGLAAVLLIGGWVASSEVMTGVTLMIPPLSLAVFVIARRDDEEVNPVPDERQWRLERSVMVAGFVTMFLVGLAATVWEIARDVPITQMRATAVFLAGCLAAVISSLILQRRS